MNLFKFKFELWTSICFNKLICEQKYSDLDDPERH